MQKKIKINAGKTIHLNLDIVIQKYENILKTAFYYCVVGTNRGPWRKSEFQN